MKIITYILLVLAIANLVSAASFTYYQARLGYWFFNHRPSQGMPDTLDMRIAYILAQPAFAERRMLER